MKQMEINYYTKNVFGVQRIYVANEETAKLVATLTRRATIEVSDIKAFESLGFKCTQVVNLINV